MSNPSEPEEQPRTREESEVEVLKGMAFARRLIEQAATILAGCTEELKLKQGPTNNAIKLIQRGWDKADEYLGREISDQSMAAFLKFIDEIRKAESARSKEEGASGPEGEAAAESSDPAGGADGGEHAGVGEAGDVSGEGGVGGS